VGQPEQVENEDDERRYSKHAEHERQHARMHRFGPKELRRQAAPIRIHDRHLTPSFDGCESRPGRRTLPRGRQALQPIKPIRVMLVDDHRSVLWGLEKLIDGDRPRMEVVGKATSCAAAMELAERISPDVVVLDLDLGGENACEIIPVLVNGGGTRVLIWTGMRDSRAREQSILRGASGLVPKEEPAATLLRAIAKEP